MDNARRSDRMEVFADPIPLSIAALAEDSTAAEVAASMEAAEDFTVVGAVVVGTHTSCICIRNEKAGELIAGLFCLYAD